MYGQNNEPIGTEIVFHASDRLNNLGQSAFINPPFFPAADYPICFTVLLYSVGALSKSCFPPHFTAKHKTKAAVLKGSVVKKKLEKKVTKDCGVLFSDYANMFMITAEASVFCHILAHQQVDTSHPEEATVSPDIIK